MSIHLKDDDVVKPVDMELSVLRGEFMARPFEQASSERVPSSAPCLTFDLQQHRRHMERPIAHDLLKARAAHSFADMKATEDGRKPSVAKDSAAKNAKKKESLDKLAKHMSQHIDASAVRSAAARVRVFGLFARLSRIVFGVRGQRSTPVLLIVAQSTNRCRQRDQGIIFTPTQRDHGKP